MNRLKEKYNKEIKSALAKDLTIKNQMALPKLIKVVVNMGVGEAAKSKQAMEALQKDMSAITGQAPSTRNAKVSIATFSLRAGMPVGLSVTLRGERMFSFLDRLFSIVLPRLRDFRGVSLKSFDKQGNYTLGIAEHTVFPEIDPTKSAQPHGMEITIVTNGGDVRGEADTAVVKSKLLLEKLGMPFQKEVLERER
jgi:large subunit ribosomal protein L5